MRIRGASAGRHGDTPGTWPSTRPEDLERAARADVGPPSAKGQLRKGSGLPTKYIFVTGGVVSSLGKGLASASIGALLEGHGFKVAMMKCDPYINVDPGTMSPYQHGEVYVTDDGAETDLDLGHYERFTHCVDLEGLQHHHRQDLRLRHRQGAPRRLPGPHRAGDPAHHRRDQGLDPRGGHAPARTDADVVIVEIGGTVGDIESLPFLEAVRQFRQDVGRENAIFVHLALVPYIATAHELKTKPMQHSVRELRAIGIQPDVLLCRTDRYLSAGHQGQARRSSATCPRRPSSRPRTWSRSTRCRWCSPARGWTRSSSSSWAWRAAAATWRPGRTWSRRIKNPKGEVTIGIVGKYVSFEDSYKSLNEALTHGGFGNDVTRDAALDRGRGPGAGRTPTEKLGGCRRHPGAGRLRQPAAPAA